MTPGTTIKTFTDLDVWQVGHQVVLDIYRQTRSFPTGEMHGLTSQMRRAAVSVTSNVAEGFSRFSYKEKAHFYSIAFGSATELHNQIFISRDVGYLPPKNAELLLEQIVRLQMILRKFIQKTKSYSSNS
jgi:four helix bundle protein